MIELDSETTFDSPVLLIDETFSIQPGTSITVTVIGYGADGILKYAEFEMISGEDCLKLYGDTGFSKKENPKGFSCIPYHGTDFNKEKKARTEMEDFGSKFSVYYFLRNLYQNSRFIF